MVVSLWPRFFGPPCITTFILQTVMSVMVDLSTAECNGKKIRDYFSHGNTAIPCPTYVHSYFFSFPICSFIPIPMRFPFPVGNLIPAAISTGADRRPDRSNAESESSVDGHCSVDVCVRRSTCRRQRARQFVRNQNAKVERFTLTSAAMHDRPVV